ncbi:hypothetical protein MDAP_001187 [Mitosporidium daphniae]
MNVRRLLFLTAFIAILVLPSLQAKDEDQPPQYIADDTLKYKDETEQVSYEQPPAGFDFKNPTPKMQPDNLGFNDILRVEPPFFSQDFSSSVKSSDSIRKQSWQKTISIYNQAKHKTVICYIHYTLINHLIEGTPPETKDNQPPASEIQSDKTISNFEFVLMSIYVIYSFVQIPNVYPFFLNRVSIKRTIDVTSIEGFDIIIFFIYLYLLHKFSADISAQKNFICKFAVISSKIVIFAVYWAFSELSVDVIFTLFKPCLSYESLFGYITSDSTLEHFRHRMKDLWSSS